MTDPTIVTLTGDYPDHDIDQYWLRENLGNAAEGIAKRVPARYADATVTVPEVAQWVRDVVDEAVNTPCAGTTRVHTGPSLLMLGPTGTGKTHEAYGAIRAISVVGLQCPWRFSTAADIYARLRPRHKVDSEEEFERIASARLLVIDDLGAAKPSEWTEEINYRLINHRYEHKLATLITSNVLPRDLGAAIGERVASRLIEMASRVVLRGEDRRRIRKTNIEGEAA